MKISIVTTLYKSAPYVAEFYQRTKKALSQLTNEYEIIFVDDGSPDDSLKRAKDLSQADENIIVIELSRNFGHHKAIMTGLSYATGEYIFLIDSDLEEAPEWLISFSEQMQNTQCDVVYGVQKSRKGKLAERWTGQLFYRLFKFLTSVNIPNNIVTTRLMTYQYVQALLGFKEREIFLVGLWHITGFDQRPQVINKLSTSKTTYSFHHKISLLINSITSFSNKPLIGVFYFGIAILFFSFMYIFYLTINWLFLSVPLTGWTSVIASIWLIGGLVISFIGLIGIYLSKIYSEVKCRPYTIIRRVYNEKS